MSLPHFRFPFRLSPFGADVVEQDELDEIGQSVQMLALTPVGSRVEVPSYGSPNQLFSPPVPNIANEIVSSLSKWEPRALVAISSNEDALDEMMRHIRITVRPSNV